MKITIITVCYNAEKTIRETINSVLGQSYEDIEYLIIDGKSTDNTLSIIQEYSQRLSCVSEHDCGIYDAMNKGITMASGELIGILNADDVYENDTVLESVVKVFSDSTIDACYADLVYVGQKNIKKIVRYWKSSDYKEGLFRSGWAPAHPTFFTRTHIYKRFGLFNLDYRIAADFELMFRLIELNKISLKYIPRVLVRMRLGGESNKSLINIIRQNKEIFNVLKRQYSDFSLFKFFSAKAFNKCNQFLRRPKNL